MKSSIVLPIFVVSGQRAAKKDKETSGEKTLRSYGECSTTLPVKGGSFVSTNYGSRGEIKLENQPLDVNCKHNIQAPSDCEQINIEYRNIALHCYSAAFSFGWTKGGSTIGRLGKPFGFFPEIIGIPSTLLISFVSVF